MSAVMKEYLLDCLTAVTKAAMMGYWMEVTKERWMVRMRGLLLEKKSVSSKEMKRAEKKDSWLGEKKEASKVEKTVGQ